VCLHRHCLAAALSAVLCPVGAVAETGSSVFIQDAWDKSTAHERVPRKPPTQPSPWRTIVVPAPFEPAPSIAGLTPRTRTLQQTIRPLTGYAHDLGGIASYYWQDQMTSSGERFNRHAHTAAHKTLPLGTRVRVTNLTNGKSTVVRINDRGPFKPGRVIDLSEAAAGDIAMKDVGLVRVVIEVVQ
jgi:rare lipoprotein A (peptidoglycan hydrolase)